jgi:hypothetical protein
MCVIYKMGPRLKPLFDAEAAQIWTGDYNRDKGQHLYHISSSVVDPHWGQCGSGSSILGSIRIQGFVDEKL